MIIPVHQCDTDISHLWNWNVQYGAAGSKQCGNIEIRVSDSYKKKLEIINVNQKRNKATLSLSNLMSC